MSHRRFEIFGHHEGYKPEDVWGHAEPMHLEMREILGKILKGMSHMATKAQLDKLQADVATLIDAGVAEITAAIAAAQRVPPEQADAAIDELDTKVTAATQSLKDAAAALALPPASPA